MKAAHGHVNRLYVLLVGHIENDLAWNLSGVLTATKGDPHRTAEWVTVPCLAYLIEHSTGGWVLYDTGFMPEDLQELPKFAQDHFPAMIRPEETLSSRLRQVGVNPSDIRQVIISHMHWDHGGGLSLFSDEEAGSHVLAGELDMSYGLLSTHRSWSEHFGESYFRKHFEVRGITFDLVDPSVGDFELLPGIEVIQLEGHTPQVLGLLVTLPRTGPVLLPSDAVYMSRNLNPVTPPGIIYDSLGFQRSAKKVQRLLTVRSAQIIYPHDPQQMDHVKLSPAYYD